MCDCPTSVMRPVRVCTVSHTAATDLKAPESTHHRIGSISSISSVSTPTLHRPPLSHSRCHNAQSLAVVSSQAAQYPQLLT